MTAVLPSNAEPILAVPSPRRRGERRSWRRYLTFTLLGWCFGIIIGFPLYWLLSSSLKPNLEILADHQTLWPHHPTLANYRALGGIGMGTWFKNSLIVSLGTTVPVLVLSMLGAYSLTRFHYRGRRLAGGFLLVGYLLPQILMIVPLFIVIYRLGLSGSYAGLILANMTYALPFALWLMRSYFETLQVQVEQAALIDGASRIRSLIDVVLPQVVPGLFSVGIFVMNATWNNYLFALVFVTDPSHYTITLGIQTYSDALNPQWGPLLASAALASLPILLTFTIFQRWFLRGFGLGRG